MADIERSARFRVQYTFTDQYVGDADAIRRELRNLSFSEAFAVEDLNHYRAERMLVPACCLGQPDRHACLCESPCAMVHTGLWRLSARRTLVDVIEAESERAALRAFLYALDIPDRIDLAGFTIERLDESVGGPAPLAAAA